MIKLPAYVGEDASSGETERLSMSLILFRITNSNTLKLVKRLFFGGVMIAALVVLLMCDGYFSCFAEGGWFRGVIFGVLVACMTCWGSVELGRLGACVGAKLPLAVVIIGVGAVVLEPFWGYGLWHGEAIAGAVLATMLIGGVVHAVKHGTAGALAAFGMICFSVVYLGIGGWFVVRIRLLGVSSGSPWGQVGGVVMFLASVKCADIGAYLIGRKIGRHKWVPSISPGKTLEGLFGGVALSVIVSSLIGGLSGIMSVWLAVVFGLVVSVVGQLGDLLESMLKRDAGSKDSGVLVPEFGGVLDLLDSVVVASPIAYLMLSCFGNFG